MSKVKVVFHDDPRIRRLPSGYKLLVRRVCNAALILEDYPADAEIRVVFTDGKYFKDVSSSAEAFDVFPCDGAVGQLYISVGNMAELARIHNRSINCELAYITFKGMLIMLGYSDNTPAERTELSDRLEWMMYRFGLPITTKYALLQYA